MINSKFLKSDIIKKIYSDSKDCDPVRFLVWEDFIEPTLYAEIEKEIQEQKYKVMDAHINVHRSNKSVILKWKKLEKLFSFLQSKAFEKYLSLYIQIPIKQEFYVDMNTVNLELWEEIQGAVAQTYEKWDFFDWHIDWPIQEWSQWAFTYYLWWYDGDWDESNGWNLELGMEENPGASKINGYYTIPYRKNTLVFIFASTIAHHRVTPLLVDKQRLSIQSTIFRK